MRRRGTDARDTHGSGDPVADRIRAARLALGLTLGQLAERATRMLAGPGAAPDAPGRWRGRATTVPPPTVSISYLSLIESGRRVPDEAIAAAIAGALDDDPALFVAWVHARKRADLSSALAAAERLRAMLGATGAGEAPRPGGLTIPSSPASALAPRTSKARAGAAPAPPFTRLRVPVISAGADPGESLHPACTVLGWRRLDASRLDPHHQARLDRPFAVRLTAGAVRRVRGLLEAGTDALVLRDALPVAAGEPYVVRHGGGTVISRLLWNGSQLLLVPDDGESDFEVIEDVDAAGLRTLVVGAVIAADFEPEGAPA